MAKARRTTFWMLIRQAAANGQETKRYVKMKRSGSSYIPGVEGNYKPGSYYLRYQEAGRRKWESVGADLGAALAELKAREAMVVNQSLPQGDSRKTLAAAVSSYLGRVKTINGHKAHKRAERLFSEFSGCVKKAFLDEITHDTLMLYMAWLRDKRAASKTIRDRLQAIETFRERNGFPRLLKKGDLPKVVKKIVDCYTEEEIENMLAAADEDERFLIHFLLATGVREQEAAHTIWDDIKWKDKVLRVSAKPNCRCPYCGDDGFRIKDYEEREIPLPDWFMMELARRKGTGLLFRNSNGNPEGHFLYTLSRLGKRVGVHATNHKFRRTFATWHHVLGGVSVTQLQKWLGHSDIETTMLYIATIEVRRGMTRDQVAATWRACPLPRQC